MHHCRPATKAKVPSSKNSTGWWRMNSSSVRVTSSLWSCFLSCKTCTHRAPPAWLPQWRAQEILTCTNFMSSNRVMLIIVIVATFIARHFFNWSQNFKFMISEKNITVVVFVPLSLLKQITIYLVVQNNTNLQSCSSEDGLKSRC